MLLVPPGDAGPPQPKHHCLLHKLPGCQDARTKTLLLETKTIGHQESNPRVSVYFCSALVAGQYVAASKPDGQPVVLIAEPARNCLLCTVFSVCFG
jgi:hypothetical protein